MKPDCITSVYLAAPYQARDIVRGFRDTVFEQANIHVTSRWLEESYAVTTGPDELELLEARKMARMDLFDVYSAGQFVTFSVHGNPGIHENSRGGRHYEMGYAHALGKPIWIIGKRQHIFEYLVDEYHVVMDVYDLCDKLVHGAYE